MSNGIHLTWNYFLPVISHETILKENCKIWWTFKTWYLFAIYQFNHMYHILLSISYLLSYYFWKSFNKWRNGSDLKLGHSFCMFRFENIFALTFFVFKIPFFFRFLFAPLVFKIASWNFYTSCYISRISFSKSSGDVVQVVPILSQKCPGLFFLWH